MNKVRVMPIVGADSFFVSSHGKIYSSSNGSNAISRSKLTYNKAPLYEVRLSQYTDGYLMVFLNINNKRRSYPVHHYADMVRNRLRVQQRSKNSIAFQRWFRKYKRLVEKHSFIHYAKIGLELS